MRETFRNIARIAAPLDIVHVSAGIRVYNGAPIAKLHAAERGSPPDRFAHVGYHPGTLTPEQIKALCAWAAA